MDRKIQSNFGSHTLKQEPIKPLSKAKPGAFGGLKAPSDPKKTSNAQIAKAAASVKSGQPLKPASRGLKAPTRIAGSKPGLSMAGENKPAKLSVKYSGNPPGGKSSFTLG